MDYTKKKKKKTWNFQLLFSELIESKVLYLWITIIWLYVMRIFSNTNEWVSESRSVVSDSLWPHGLYSSWNSPGQNTGEGSHYLLQGIFPNQGWNSGLSHCRRILYQLSLKGTPSNMNKNLFRGALQPRFNLLVKLQVKNQVSHQWVFTE